MTVPFYDYIKCAVLAYGIINHISKVDRLENKFESVHKSACRRDFTFNVVYTFYSNIFRIDKSVV